MHKRKQLCRAAGLAGLLAAASTPGHALPCEELRRSVEAKIRARGVAAFSVVVVDAAASAAGPVVGSCDLGTRKLVYLRGAGPAASAAAAVPAPRPPAKAAVITECADGRVITTGTCRK